MKKNSFSARDSLDLLDALDAIVYVADLQSYELLYLNKKAQELFGDGVGDKCWKILQSGQEEPCSFCTNDQLFNMDGSPAEPCVWEFQNTLNGDWWECRDRAIKWLDGRYVRLEIATNITDRKNAEQQLLKSEQKFRLLANATHDWEYWIDPDGNYKYISPACEPLTGLSPQQFVENPALFFDIIAPADRERVYHHYTTQEEKLAPAHTIEFSIIATDGRELLLEHYCAPVYDDNGDFAGRCGNNRDITERRRTEEKIRLSEERLSFALKGAKCGLWDWYLRDNVFHFDENYYRIAGYEPNEFPQTFGEWEKRVHAEDLEETKLRLQSYMAGESESFSVEFRFQKKTSGWLWILAQGEFVEWDEAGTPLRISGLHIDIDDSKQAEFARLELEQQLRQKFKMEAVGTMAGGIAHNFNNSLAVIFGSLEMAQRKLDDPQKVSAYLASAKTAALRSRDLVQQILNYSRQEVLEKKPVQIALVVDETQKLLRPTIPTSIDFHYRVAADCLDLSVEANPGQIQEAILNLTNNAVQAMEEQGSLCISLDRVELTAQEIPAQHQCEPGAFARISVQDSGCGIEPDILNKVFDLFFTTKGVNHGTGIGLSTVQGIMQQHAGLVTVKNVLPQGCVFELYFPLNLTELGRVPVAVTAIQRGDERILLVDDDQALQEISVQMLSEVGYRVTAVTRSSNALELIRQHPEEFDLLITDQTMPEMTGKDLALEVKKLNPELPIILCTGYSNMISAEDAGQFGINAFCAKPLQLAELTATIRKVLEDR